MAVLKRGPKWTIPGNCSSRSRNCMFTTTQAAYGRLAGENRTVFQLEYLEYIFGNFSHSKELKFINNISLSNKSTTVSIHPYLKIKEADAAKSSMLIFGLTKDLSLKYIYNIPASSATFLSSPKIRKWLLLNLGLWNLRLLLEITSTKDL